MRPLLTVVGLAVLSTLAACAGDPPISSGSAYGLYLAGNAAGSAGDSRAAGRYYSAAKASGAEASNLDQQIFMAALDEGDIAAAARVAPPKSRRVDPAAGADDADDSDPGDLIYEIGILTRLTALMAAGDGKGALALEEAEPLTFLRSATAQLEPWMKLVAGQVPDGLDRPAPTGRTLAVANLMSHARLALAAGKPDLAEADFKTLEAGGFSAATIIDHGALLERAGRGAEAKALYTSALVASPDRADLKAALDRATAGGKPPPPLTAAMGAAQTLFAQSEQMLRVAGPALQIAFLRMGLAVDPVNYQAWMDLGDALQNGRDLAGALAAYRKIPENSPDGPATMARIAGLYQEAGDSAKALAVGSKAAAITPADTSAGVAYAEILAQNERYAEAIKVYDRLIDQASPADWRLYYRRWRTQALAGNDPAGEADLQAALKLAPNEAELLNALGYSWIDRNENLDQAMGMIRRAAVAKPNDGQITDSLGWGYFRQGDYANAVTQLEAAVQLEPAEAEINDHLGDAYWRAGRHIEARFQWERTLTLSPNPALKAKAQAKLQDGLPAIGSAMAQAGA